ncbi:MAG: nucleotidyltransferase domain-containing protein [Oscillibacter sp.]|nr:nucleotidyltransferase domain-containing protein [Oscillibacter sp.]MBQ9617534.1 nucleotidyltransferase domain-containing protein [Oscillibacter sp.]
MLYTIEELKDRISPLARIYGVKSVSLFGSYARGTARPDSDVDLKIEKGALRSLYQLCGFRLAVEDALRVSVDLVTSESSDRDFLKRIEQEEVLLYRTP